MADMLLTNYYECRLCGFRWVDETEHSCEVYCPRCRCWGCRPVRSEEAPWFRNYYQCWRCGYEWEDEWSGECDDECPECDARDCCPVRSEPLNEAARRPLPSDTW